MLKQRVITALILASLIIWGVLGLPTAGFAALFGLVVILAAWEWGGLLGRGHSGALGFAGLIVGLLALGWWQRENSLLLHGLLGAAAVFWLLALVWLYRFSQTPHQRDPVLLLIPVGIVLLLPPWLALLALRETARFGAAYVLFLLFLIWIADSGAYFAGRAWGQRKLAPKISPGKTWEGAFGAFGTSLLMALFGAWLLGLGLAQWPGFMLLSLIVVGFSIIGDLFESMIKRQRGVKDSSHILPGHGGILDRVDSLTAAAPLFLLGLFLLNGASP